MSKNFTILFIRLQYDRDCASRITTQAMVSFYFLYWSLQLWEPVPLAKSLPELTFLGPFILILTQRTAIYVLVSDRSGHPDVLCHGGVDICESGRE